MVSTVLTVQAGDPTLARMGLSFRHYLFPDDGSLRRIPQRIADALPLGRDAIPEYAGTTQRVAYVIIELEDAKPARILDARGELWEFDDEGRVDEHLRRGAAARMALWGSLRANKKSGPVVDLVPELKRRELDARDRWTLTAEDLDRIAADLWPGIHGPAPEVTTVKGKVPRRPPLTHEGRWALEQIQKQVAMIRHELAGLSERALKGLAFEAQRTGLWEEEMIWRGISDECRRLEAIRAANRNGRGEWYAVLEVARAHADKPYLWEQVIVTHAKCTTRNEAVEAGRQMMAEKGGWLDADTEISVNIRSALEWRPEEWE